MTSKVKKNLQENNTLVTNIAANMIRFYQPLDLTVNGSAEKSIVKKSNG